VLAREYYRNEVRTGEGADPCTAVARMHRAIAALPTRPQPTRPSP
jgi:hypothetical protein